MIGNYLGLFVSNSVFPGNGRVCHFFCLIPFLKFQIKKFKRYTLHERSPSVHTTYWTSVDSSEHQAPSLSPRFSGSTNKLTDCRTLVSATASVQPVHSLWGRNNNRKLDDFFEIAFIVIHTNCLHLNDIIAQRS